MSRMLWADSLIPHHLYPASYNAQSNPEAGSAQKSSGAEMMIAESCGH